MSGTSHYGYDLFPDGERFVMVQSSEEPPHLNVILNWFSELERRVAALESSPR